MMCAGLAVIVDKCNSIWSTKGEAKQVAYDASIRHELEMHQVLKDSTSDQPLGQDSAIRSFIQVCSICKYNSDQ